MQVLLQHVLEDSSKQVGKPLLLQLNFLLNHMIIHSQFPSVVDLLAVKVLEETQMQHYHSQRKDILLILVHHMFFLS